jgi:Transcriptional regulators
MDVAKDLFFAQQGLRMLFSVTNKLQVLGDKELEDLTIRQMLAIPALIHAPIGKATINYVARHLGTTKQNAKQIVDAMAKKGYLAITPSEQDKRAVNVTVTLAGEQAFKKCSERTDGFLATIFEGFTSEELEKMYILLRKLYGFDGIEQESLEGHVGYNSNEASEILRHHQSFAKRRALSQSKGKK